MLIIKLFTYNINLFGEGPVKNITSCKELDETVVQDLLNAPALNNKKFI